MDIVSARNSYPFFKEKEHAHLRKQFVENDIGVLELLQNEDFETFYKIFPIKDYCGDWLKQQSLSKEQLSQTEWFRQHIIAILTSYQN